MPVYMVIEVTVRDREVYAEYMRRVPATVEQYGGRYVVRGGRVVALTGDWNPERVVILEFPTAQHMERWNASPEYAAVAPLRARSATTRAIALEGYAPPHG
jgi:uncharacterized protein (DUF1330 family)